MIKRESIQFQARKNSDVKYTVFERAQRPSAIDCKNFTHKNTYRYIDNFPKFVKTYNDTLHSSTGWRLLE